MRGGAEPCAAAAAAEQRRSAAAGCCTSKPSPARPQRSPAQLQTARPGVQACAGKVGLAEGVWALTGDPYVIMNSPLEELATFKKYLKPLKFTRWFMPWKLGHVMTKTKKKKKKLQCSALILTTSKRWQSLSKTGSQSKLPAGSCDPDRCFSLHMKIWILHMRSMIP